MEEGIQVQWLGGGHILGTSEEPQEASGLEQREENKESMLVYEQILSDLLIYDKQCAEGHERCRDKSRVSSLGQQ